MTPQNPPPTPHDYHTTEVTYGDKTMTIYLSPPPHLSMEEDAVHTMAIVSLAPGRQVWLATSWMGRKAYFLVQDGIVRESWVGIGNPRSTELLQETEALKLASAERDDLDKTITESTNPNTRSSDYI